VNAFPPSRVGAFFDIDGTLIAKPSLEWRFFASLIRRGAIPKQNYLHWLAQALRVAPQGLSAMRHANKMYLRGISHLELLTESKNGCAPMATRSFLPNGLQQLTWHAQRGHQIVLVTGTLEPLAQEIAQALTTLLAIREIDASVALCATVLEERNGRWTGRVDSAPMFGRAKASAIRNLANELHLDLSRSYAYADSFTDREMLESVAYPAAVNPSPRLRQLARERHWQILSWPAKSNPSRFAEAEPQACSSGQLFRPKALPQHEHFSASEKIR